MTDTVLAEARELISDYLKNRRQELGMTQQELADLSGMGIATIKRFESGKFWFNMKQYLLICHYLKCFPSLETIDSENQFAQKMRQKWKL